MFQISKIPNFDSFMLYIEYSNKTSIAIIFVRFSKIKFLKIHKKSFIIKKIWFKIISFFNEFFKKESEDFIVPIMGELLSVKKMALNGTQKCLLKNCAIFYIGIRIFLSQILVFVYFH